MITTKIKKIREESNISQRGAARKLKVSKSNYNRWETAENIIPLERLRDFCNTFSVSMDYIFGFSNTNNYAYIDTLDRIVIGKRLKEIRVNNKTTQEELAKILNTSHSTISAYEHGKTLILTAFLYQVCKTFKVSMDEICLK